jgi:hypothetical protein
VSRIAAQLDLANEHLQDTVHLVDARLSRNRLARERLAA